MANTHRLYETCKRAYYNTSFSPERRGETEVKYFEEQLAEFKELCGDDTERYNDIAEKFERKFLAHMSAKSRCASSMITGPANFPVARIEKANNAERKRGDEVTDFVEKVKKRIHRENNPSDHISSDNKDALQLLKAKLMKMQIYHQQMKDCNAILRDKKTSTAHKIEAIMKATTLTKERATELLDPDFAGRTGFAGFYLTNNLADMKRIKGRIIVAERNTQREHKEHDLKGIKVVENVEANRIQLIFPDKPDSDTRSLLKSRGFRWSPKFGAWQRMLNGNGMYATKQVLKQL